MKQYSFLTEFDAAAAKQAGSAVMNWVKANPAKTGAIAGGLVGGTINKARGGSFIKGASKGALVGTGVGYGANKIAGTKFGQNIANTTKKIMKPASKASSGNTEIKTTSL